MILQKPSSIGNSPICDHTVAEGAYIDKLCRNLTVTWLTVDWRHKLTEIGRLCMGGVLVRSEYELDWPALAAVEDIPWWTAGT